MRFLLNNLLILLILNSCIRTDALFYKVVDYKTFMGEGQSHKLNTIDRFCLMYYNSSDRNNTRNFDPILLEQQVTTELENLGMNIKREGLITKAVTHEESEHRRKTIAAREKKNNYKNCNMLIAYDLFILKGADGCLSMRIYDLEWYSEIGDYQICKGVFRREKQAEFVRRAIQKLWEYQERTTRKPPKTVSYECSGYGCKTIECIGDTCTTTTNSPYRQ